MPTDKKTKQILVDAGVIPLGDVVIPVESSYTAKLRRILEAVYATPEGDLLRKKRLANQIDRLDFQLEVMRIWKTLPASKEQSTES